MQIQSRVKNANIATEYLTTVSPSTQYGGNYHGLNIQRNQP